ncbi:MAG: maleylpyruvate isomerase family mycothiol-dependent enzyme [Euzebya sp.]
MDYLDHIAHESEVFLHVALDGSMDVMVPSCPEWTMTDLVGHLGIVQWFHGGHLIRGVTDAPPGPRPPAPETGLAEWFREGTRTLLQNLRTVGTATPAWTFLGVPANPTSGFWHRRMALEAAIHRWDAQFARGRAEGFDTELALDGIDEVVSSWVPSKRRGEEPQGTVTVVCTDGGQQFVMTHGDPDAAQATVTGTADDLWVALWGRIPLTDLDVRGDLDLARSVRAR